MRNLKRLNRFASESLEAEDVVAIEALEEQLADQLGIEDVNPKVSENDELVAEAEKILKDFETEETQDEVKQVIESCDKLEKEIESSEADTVAPDDKAIISEEKEILDACEKLEAKIASMEAEEAPAPVEEVKTASEVKPGVEDEIGDEADGGDASVSSIVDTKIDVSTDKEVFPTNSEYVAKITARLDRVANILEKRGMKRMALRVDQLSDKLEASILK